MERELVGDRQWVTKDEMRKGIAVCQSLPGPLAIQVGIWISYKGVYAAAIGTILGACVLLGKIAIGDWLTALIALGSLVVLFRWKISNPVLVAATAVIGLIAFPLLKPGWVFVKSPAAATPRAWNQLRTVGAYSAPNAGSSRMPPWSLAGRAGPRSSTWRRRGFGWDHENGGARSRWRRGCRSR